MKNTYKFIGLCSCLLFIGAGSTVYANSKRMFDNLEKNLPENPKLAIPFPAPENDTKFTMRIIKPKPGVGCKIMRVMPDPNIDYKIRIVDPQSLSSLRGSNTRRR